MIRENDNLIRCLLQELENNQGNETKRKVLSSKTCVSLKILEDVLPAEKEQLVFESDWRDHDAVEGDSELAQLEGGRSSDCP